MAVELFNMPVYPLPGISQADDAGQATSGTYTKLTDKNKFWTPGIWQGALLILSIDNQVRVTQVNNNSTDSLSFPALPGQIPPGAYYLLKRLPPTLVRSGISLTASQQLKEFVYAASELVPSPYPLVPWINAEIPPGGTYTAVPPSPNVMIDGAAAFAPNLLVGMVIFNTTDKSWGAVFFNNATTIMSTPLAGGFTNLWHTGDTYLLGAHLANVETGLAMPWVLQAGYFGQIVAERWVFDQDNSLNYFVDGALIAIAGVIQGGVNTFIESPAGLSTLSLDPTASNPHLVDFIIVNKGLSPMHGSAAVLVISEQFTAP